MDLDTVAVNGEVRRLGDLRLGDFPQSFFFGAGFFETFLVSEGAPLFLTRHLARLQASLAAHAGPVRAPPPEVLAPEAVRDTLRRCLAHDDRMGPRFTGVGKLVAGDGRLLLSFRPLPTGHDTAPRDGLALDTLEARVYRRGDPSLGHKSVSYLRQYVHLGRGTVFTNEDDEWCEAPNGNLVFLVEGLRVTPPLDAPCLPGIIRAVLREPDVHGEPWVREQPVRRDALGTLHGCILTNSVGLALPVHRLLGRDLPDSARLAEEARARVWARAHAEP